jgi:acetyltransferase-like isoleucine patch superfamily enzyme
MEFQKMTEIDKTPIIFEKGIPKKNKFIQGILFTKILLVLPFVRSIIKRWLTHCHNVYIIPGFYCFYGNIYAKNVGLSNTILLDYAPIYIGEDSRFAFDNLVITSTHDYDDFSKVIAKPVVIGKNVFITSRCIILGGVTIGDNSVIAAGSVVTKDIPPNCLAGGNPAKVIKYYSQTKEEKVGN